MWVTSCTDAQGKLCERGHHVNHKQLCLHARTRVWLFWVERWQCTKVILICFLRDIQEGREFYQGKTVKTQQRCSCASPCSIRVFLLSFYPWRHSREKMCQAFFRLTILQTTGSWARAWERGNWTQCFQVPQNSSKVCIPALLSDTLQGITPQKLQHVLSTGSSFCCHCQSCDTHTTQRCALNRTYTLTKNYVVD